VLFVGAIALVGALLLANLDAHGYDHGVELLNFGALIAFMGVNLASLTRYFIRGEDRSASQLIVPVLGFLICFFIWIHLSRLAWIAGPIWIASGLVYGAWKTRGFRSELVTFDIPPDDAS
jgi:hypothetical protein